MAKLAINGGTPIRHELFPSQNTIGSEEKIAAQRVLNSGILTGYQGNYGPNFRGGKEVRALEEEWSAKFNVKHSICCNSATSGLLIACGAAGMNGADSGDAIVSPFSMTCSATVPLIWKHGVRFGDIERDYYCLSVQSVREHLFNTFSKFSAIIPVSLFGMPYDSDGLNQLLNTLDVNKRPIVIEDAAQALGAKCGDRFAGTLGDIGVYSFNLGKHLTCGEGGMIVTDNDELAMRCRLIMNHAEAVVNDMPSDTMREQYSKIVGLNLRMTEISAAIVRVQLAKMDMMINHRIENVNYLVNKLKNIPCLSMPEIRENCTHTYYVLPLKYKNWIADEYGDRHSEKGYKLPIHRDKFIDAVKAELKPVKDRENEGVTIGCGYIKPIQSMPIFNRSLDETTECARQWQDELIIIHRMFGPMASRKDLDDIYFAFEKAWNNRNELEVINAVY